MPLLVVDGQPLNQIVAICDYLDRRFPQARLLPSESWQRAQAMSLFAWMNNTVHPTFTRIFRSNKFAASEAGQADVRNTAVATFRECLERIRSLAQQAGPLALGRCRSIASPTSV